MNEDLPIQPVPLLAREADGEGPPRRIARLLMAKVNEAIDAAAAVGDDSLDGTAEQLFELAESRQATDPSYAADLLSVAQALADRRAAEPSTAADDLESLLDRAEQRQSADPSYAADLRAAAVAVIDGRAAA